MRPSLLSLAIYNFGSLLLAVFSFGLNTGAGINPARDMGPRLLSALAGWPGTFSVSIQILSLHTVHYYHRERMFIEKNPGSSRRSRLTTLQVKL